MNKLVILLFGITIIGICYSASTDPCDKETDGDYGLTDDIKGCNERKTIPLQYASDKYKKVCCWVEYQPADRLSDKKKKCEEIINDASQIDNLIYEYEMVGYTKIDIQCSSSYLAITILFILSFIL